MLIPLILIISHLIAVFIKGQLIYPELLTYPYFLSHGFLPYRDLMDQHFPGFILGPISLPDLSSHPQLIPIIFFVLILFTDIFFYLFLLKKNPKTATVLFSLWVSFSLWFGTNIFWIETFMVFLLAVFLFLPQKTSLQMLASGIVLGVIFVSKPMIIVGLLLYSFFSRHKIKLETLLGAGLVLVLNLFYLVKNNLFPYFWNLAIEFNSRFYSHLALKTPTSKELLIVLVAILVIIGVHQGQKSKLLLVVLAMSTLIYPRFELFHLLPALLIGLASVDLKDKSHLTTLSLSSLLLLCFLVNAVRHPVGAYFSKEDQHEVINYLQSRDGESTLYVIGGNELLYPYTNRLPPNFVYLPPLPWYYQDEVMVNKQFEALKTSPGTVILVDTKSTLGDKNIFQSTGKLADYIEKYYQKTATVGRYQVYEQVP